jgi:tetratricopeptide (TPR) repeat protein
MRPSRSHSTSRPQRTLDAQAELHLRDDSSQWADRLEREHDNIRVALDHLEASRDTQATLRLAGAVSRFWYMKSHLTEGRRRLESALAADGRPTTARGKALNGAAVMALNLGDSSAARSHAEEALATHRELGEAWAATYSGMMIGNALAEGHDLATAKPILEEAVKRFRELGDAHYATVTIFNLAWVVGDLGDHERDRALLQEALEQARALRIERLEGAALVQLSIMERDDGRLADASSMLKQGLRISHRLGDRLDVAIGLGRLASILVLLGQAELAARLVASSEALTEQVGTRMFYWAAERNEQTLAAIRAQLDGAALEAAWHQGRAMTMDEAMALALESPSEAPG